MKFLKTLFSPAARKAQAALVVSAFGLAGVYGFADPSLEAGILSAIAAIGNVVSVFYAINKSA